MSDATDRDATRIQQEIEDYARMRHTCSDVS